MLQKIILFSIVYILLRFPIGLLEDWFMGEVLEQMESKGFLLFLFLWILPILLTISLFAAGVWARNLIKNYKTKVATEYQPKSPRVVVGLSVTATVIVGKAGGLIYDLNTNNKKNRLLEAKVPIQAVRFTKPKDVVVRPTFLPVVIECESSFWKRFRNKLLSVPKPRIIVKSFTDKGVVWDEENTVGADIFVEFYANQYQLWGEFFIF